MDGSDGFSGKKCGHLAFLVVRLRATKELPIALLVFMLSRKFPQIFHADIAYKVRLSAHCR
jgi:hypothetical protein